MIRCLAKSPEGHRCDIASGHIGPHLHKTEGEIFRWTAPECCPSCASTNRRILGHPCDWVADEWHEASTEGEQ